MVGSVVGGLYSAALHIDTYIGAIDLQIGERGKAVGKSTLTATAKQGASAMQTTEIQTESNMATYQTRLVAWAKQTRINKVEAAQAVAQKLAEQIGGLF